MIDKEWFVGELQRNRKSLRGLARHLDIDPSAASRMLSGDRKMKLTEAEQIARFLTVPTEEVLRHAGIDLDTIRTARIDLAAIISESGKVEELSEPRALPASVIARAQAAITGESRGQMVAAQVRASKGALQIWDDAVVLFERSDIVQPAAVGVLSIVKLREGVTMLGHLDKARKTGEATMRGPDGQPKEVVIASASPVLAVVP